MQLNPATTLEPLVRDPDLRQLVLQRSMVLVAIGERRNVAISLRLNYQTRKSVAQALRLLGAVNAEHDVNWARCRARCVH